MNCETQFKTQQQQAFAKERQRWQEQGLSFETIEDDKIAVLGFICFRSTKSYQYNDDTLPMFNAVIKDAYRRCVR